MACSDDAPSSSVSPGNAGGATNVDASSGSEGGAGVGTGDSGTATGDASSDAGPNGPDSSDAQTGSGPIHPNEPTGMQLVGEYDWSSGSNSGNGKLQSTQTWQTRSGENDDHYLLRVKLADNGPLGPNDAPWVVRHFYPQGAEGGGGNELVGPNGESGLYSQNFSEIYVRYYVRVNDSWDGHSSGINKMIYIHDDPGSAFSAMWYEMKASGAGPLRVYLVNQSGSSPTSLTPSPDSERFIRGSWHRVEIHQIQGMSNDGTVRMWVDGEQVLDDSNVDFKSNRIRHMVLSGIWGGVGDSKGGDDYMDFAYVRVSGR